MPVRHEVLRHVRGVLAVEQAAQVVHVALGQLAGAAAALFDVLSREPCKHALHAVVLVAAAACATACAGDGAPAAPRVRATRGARALG